MVQEGVVQEKVFRWGKTAHSSPLAVASSSAPTSTAQRGEAEGGFVIDNLLGFRVQEAMVQEKVFRWGGRRAPPLRQVLLAADRL